MVDKREGKGIGARVIERNITPIYTNDGFKRVVIKIRGGEGIQVGSHYTC